MDPFEQLKTGPKRAIADLLAALEADDGILRQADLLDRALAARTAQVIGVTGPPGAGKSTAINLMVQAFREREHTVAIVAVDPSSRRTGGALLGDRNRFDLDPLDGGILTRSLAARSQLGGLAEAAIGAVVLLSAIFDKVIVETVGVGQSETDISELADTVVVAVQPASGDSLQFMKAGIMEIPDILAVTKADLGAIAERAARDMAMAARAQVSNRQWQPQTFKLASTRPLAESGMPELVAEIERHFDHLQTENRLARKRSGQLQNWCQQLIQNWFGRLGARSIGDHLNQDAPFADLAARHRQLSDALDRASSRT